MKLRQATIISVLTRVAICEKGAYGEEDFGDGECRAPVVFEDVKADDALTVDVAMVDAGPEGDLGRLEGVLGGEMDVQEKDTALVDGPGWSQDS